MAAIGARRATFSSAGRLLPLLVLALLLQAPSASARHWFWYDALFPVTRTGETNPAAAFTAETEGAAARAAAAAPAPAPAPAVSCHDAPVGRLIASGAAPDPCAALAAELKRTAGKLGGKTGGQGFAAPSFFCACLSTFVFRKDCDVEDLLSIANAFDNHYVYKYIAMDSPDQTNLPSSIDIVAELRKIVANGEKGKYARLVDAHMAAYRAVLALNDGHSAFVPSCFFGDFNLPLPLMAVVENGQQIIRVAPRRYVTPIGMEVIAKVLHNFDFSLYQGRQWKGRRGGTNIVQVPGDFARQGVAPENDTLLVSFATENSALAEDVKVPWIGTGSLTDFANATEYWARYCAVEPSGAVTGSTSAQASARGHADTPVIYKFLKRHPDPVYYDDTSDGSDDLNVEIASLSAAADGSSGAVAGPTIKRISPKDDLYLVYLMDSSTAVIWLHTFIDDIKAKEMEEEVAKAFQTVASSNASQIIIDVRGNGGGSAVASYTAIRLLMGPDKVPDSNFTMPVDFVIGTQYTESAIGALAVDRKMLYYYRGYADLNGTALSSAFGYAPFRELRFTEAGPAGNYSAPFKMKYQFAWDVTEPVFGDRPFLVLSDGNCFSACAILTHVLGKRHKVPMVTVGGLSKLATVLPENASLPLKVKGSVGMAFTNGYVDSKIPCEFEFLPSWHHINYTVDLIDKPWAIWNEVAKLFASTAA
ncbi:unnamed protein product [Closterium sp. Yama58-4]|nr:unnamed protein product [Closterium sp. Yama58-4]